MSTNVAEEIQCPICIDTLTKPIRMLPCGQNLCHTCLATLCQNNQDKKCPTCRTPIVLPGNGVDGISRNITLENVIESLAKMKVNSQSRGEDSATPQTIQSLQDSSVTNQQQSGIQKEMETLQKCIDDAEGLEKLQPSIGRAHRLLCLKDFEEANFVCVSIASIVDTNETSRLTDQSRNVYNQNLKDLTWNFVNVKEYDCAFSLIRCKFQFVKNHYDGESMLVKLENIAWLMAQISKEMAEHNQQEKFKEQYSLMEEILEFMQNTKNVDLKIKCKNIVWFLYYSGICCNNVEDWYKSINHHKCAITLMKTVFDVEASRYQVFGLCHNNMGWPLENINQLFEAKTVYTKAIEIYNTVSDWPSEEEKSSFVSGSMNNLKRTEEKISENQT